jgi:CBS domain-containing protein
MSKIADIMSTDVRTIQPQESLREAARCMQELDVGALPVCDGERLLGMLTDRDIAVRGVAGGLDPEQACVSDIMSPHVDYLTVDQDSDDAKRLMGEKQIRRLPVIDDDRRLVGIVSLGDLALREDGHIDRAVREISEPGQPS